MSGLLKKASLFLLTAVLSLGLLPVAAFALDEAEMELPTDRTFSDVPQNEWYYPYVYKALDLGLFSGYTGTDLFGPDDTLNRGMVVTLLYRAYTGKTADTTDNNVTTVFTDVPYGEWYTAAVKWAAETGITTGISPTLFDPEAPVTREQLATFIGRYAAYVQSNGKTVDLGYVDASLMQAMPDAEQVDSFARTGMAWCINNGIISGKGSTYGTKIIDPKARATRAEMAKIITVTVRDVLHQK